jgi:hypothetical protein
MPLGLELKPVTGVTACHANFYSKDMGLESDGVDDMTRNIKKMLVDCHYASVRAPTEAYWAGRA